MLPVRAQSPAYATTSYHHVYNIQLNHKFIITVLLSGSISLIIQVEFPKTPIITQKILQILFNNSGGIPSGRGTCSKLLP